MTLIEGYYEWNKKKALAVSLTHSVSGLDCVQRVGLALWRQFSYVSFVFSSSTLANQLTKTKIIAWEIVVANQSAYLSSM